MDKPNKNGRMEFQFGPVEYAILGNGALLLLLLIILSFTIYRLRKMTCKRNKLKEKGILKLDPDNVHQSFSTLCGLPSPIDPHNQGNHSSRVLMDNFNSKTQTLPKKMVRIQQNEESRAYLLPPQPQPSLWIAFPHQHQPQYFPTFTLNIPPNKKRTHQCMRTQSCRVPSILTETQHSHQSHPMIHQTLKHQTLKHKNLEQLYGKY